MDKILQQLYDIESELEDDRDNPDLWMEHGIGKHLLGEYQLAVESFKKALGLNNRNASCHFNLANSLVELERYEEAVHHYLEAIDIQPDHIPSLNNLADAYEMAGQPERSREIFHYLVHLNPEDPLSHFNLGNFFLRNNQHVEAAGCYEKTILLDQHFIDAYFNIAWILKEVGAGEEALGYAEDGLSIDPAHEDLKKITTQLKSNR
jgi:tetratricopeptide (TPR) repeat protein